jgi:pyroglutamyl-peptidase
VLLTGFEPFGGETVNVSWLVAQALAADGLPGARVHAVELPCVFGASLQVLDAVLARWRPTHVLCLGQAAGRGGLSFERVAVNLDDARIPDNAGASPLDLPVVPGGPVAYFTRWAVKHMVQAAQRAGVPAELSFTAGSFVCNHVFYGLLHRVRRRRTVGGFLHLPLLPEQAPRFPGLPVLALDEQVRGTQAALRAGLAHDGGPDLAVTGGVVA